MNLPPVISAARKSSPGSCMDPTRTSPQAGGQVSESPGQCHSRESAGTGLPDPSILERTRISAPVWAFAGLLLLLAVARLSEEWNLPLPFCGLKRLTGIPCPFCGSTRCLQACSRLDIAQAVCWNPLTFLACLGVVLWLGVWIADVLFNRRGLSAVRRWLAAPALEPVLIIAVLLNWIYLCLTLP